MYNLTVALILHQPACVISAYWEVLRHSRERRISRCTSSRSAYPKLVILGPESLVSRSNDNLFRSDLTAGRACPA